MKKILVIFLLTFATASIAAAQANLKQDKTVHNFGRFDEGPDKTCTFTVTNTGDQPLIIISVSKPCGCTEPEFSNEPIMPGKTGTIKVTYHSKGHPGAFYKTMQIKVNTAVQYYEIAIQGDVVPEKVPAKLKAEEPAGKVEKITE